VGRIVFDGIALLKQAFLSYTDYKLDTVAREVLGEKKIELEDDFWDKFPQIVKKEPERVAEYNLKDSVLVIKILKNLKLIELMVKKSLITGMQLDRVKGSVASLDSLYIRRATKKGYVCPNSSFAQRTERIKGAYVMSPKAGVYDWVAVFDFKSLYPSVMRTYNIDPISFAKGGEIKAPNGATFENGKGILPEIIEMLGRERDLAKKENDKTKSYAIKIIMNSFYGVIANPSCRFYSLDMGNAITSFARETIKETSRLIEGMGYEVLYGDTDSVFVDLKTESFEQSRKLGDKISARVNEHFDKQVRQKYNRKSLLELEFEKMFKVLMLPRMRGGGAGAKKRYAGLLVRDGREEIKVTGMEIVRRDWTDLAKELQKELLERVFHKKQVASYIKQLVERLKAGKLDDKLVYRKSIRKDLEDYTKTTPPHVKAARMLPKLSSNIIEYYMTTSGPMPVEIAEKKKARLDYEHYLEKQVRPIADTILELFGTSFDEAIKNSSQKNLFDY
jgi:DNA polymerase-2